MAKALNIPNYSRVALVLQGGGALGSYQAGIVEGLYEVGIHPTWVAGISIGALNAAIIAGNAPEKRVEKLWIDLIFERPEMNEVILRDVTLSRRPRAEL